LKFFG